MDPKEPIRKRLKRRETANRLRFLTFSSYQRLPLFGNAAIRDEFVRALDLCRTRHGFRLVAWVIMPEHIHLLIVPRPISDDQAKVPSISWSLKKPFADKVVKRWEVLNARVLDRIVDDQGIRHFWQPGGGFDRNVRTEHEAWRTLAYIHQNPVKRGLVSEPTQWGWSSARWYAGEREGQLPIDE